MKLPIGSVRIQTASLVGLFLGVALVCMDSSAGRRVIGAEEIVDNSDSSKTYIYPRILGEAERFGIRQGIPGACRLFGMEGYLKDYVVWSSDLKKGVPVADDGTLGDVETAHYVESMTCTSSKVHWPKITLKSISENADGSVTVRLPRIHYGPENFLVLSGHVGVCRLLGYDETVGHSREWSTQATAGVSLAADGQIYEKSRGTYLTALGCRSGSQK